MRSMFARSLLLAAALPQSVAAREPDVTEMCLTAHEQGQRARQSASLLDAREQLRRCAADECPQLVRQDCVPWLADVQAMIPSISFFVTLDGKPTTIDRIWLDDDPIPAAQLAGQIELDPGPHAFVGEKDVAGKVLRLELSVVISPSVRNQSVRFGFERPPAPVARPVVRHDSEPAPSSGRSLRIAGFTTLGIAGATAIAWGVVGGLALRDRSRADADCAPFCASSRVSSIRRRLIAADALAVSAAVLALTSAILIGVGYKRRARSRTARAASRAWSISGSVVRF